MIRRFYVLYVFFYVMSSVIMTELAWNPYRDPEFSNFSIKQIKEFNRMFRKYDVDNSEYIDQIELKLMMEALEAPQTFLGLKKMISTVDTDDDNTINFKEFLLIFKKAADGELSEGSGLYQLVELAELS